MQYAFKTGGELIHTYENLFAFGITNHHDMFNELRIYTSVECIIHISKINVLK